jgi:hypothetical protein
LDVTVFERLISAGEVLDTLAAEHDRRGTFANWEICKDAAQETILARLVDGQLVAWATACKIDCDHPATSSGGEIIAESDFYSGSEIGEVPIAFWCHFHNAGKAGRTVDLVSNDFRFDFVDAAFVWRTGGAYNVAFDRRGLPHLNYSSALTLANAVVAEEANITPRMRAPSVKAARPPSEDKILAKADEMRGKGMDTYSIASRMRFEPGFENVATRSVRDIIRGRYPRSGRAGIPRH